MRYGEAAEDVITARYAVAFARERQRRFKRSSFRFGLALGATLGFAAIVFAVYLLKRSEVVRAVAVAGFAALVLAKAEPFSLGRLLSVGGSSGLGVAIAAVIGVVVARSREDQADGRPVAEYQHLRDLD